jgi:putative transcriptional regulator
VTRSYMVALAGRWGRSLRAARQASGLEQVELAKRVGCSQGTISRIESGAQVPKDELRIALARALGMSVAELFTYEKVKR